MQHVSRTGQAGELSSMRLYRERYGLKTEELPLENPPAPLTMAAVSLEDTLEECRLDPLFMRAAGLLACGGRRCPPGPTTAASCTNGWTRRRNALRRPCAAGIRQPGTAHPQSKGYEIKHLDAQKTAEQAAADEKKRLDAEQRQLRDKNLLSTYASMQEIERLRDQRLTLLADQIKVTNQFLEN